MWCFYVTCVVLYLSVVSCEPVIKTTKGAIRGKVLKSRYGRDYYSFTGVPYGKPPVGDLRFKVVFTISSTFEPYNSIVLLVDYKYRLL